MARAEISRGLDPHTPRLAWQGATVIELVEETDRVTSLVLDPPDWPGHRAGQHVDVRLTAEDGYVAERSYSIASAPGDGHLMLTVERLDDGEVSPYLVEELRPGDELELRGPIGGYFVWEESLGGPVGLIGGGSGIVPLRAIIRHWVATGHAVPVRTVYSSRSWSEVIYRDELLGDARNYPLLDLRFALTREWPGDYTGHTGRIDRPLLELAIGPPTERPLVYICGPNAFVEAAAGWLVEIGHDAGRIRTERFGPTGT
ncbi:MAG TPA: ferredoxin reductase [Solirubrobacteraceae bacterium]|nr:ferredoxin reductase [Solirubrobacteraceae bacterium]